jgi:excisionase family DNA binding protein
MTKNQPASERLLTLDEVAEYLNMHNSTVYKLLRQKKLPGFKVGNQWRFKHQMIEDWLMENAKRK